MDFTVVWTDPGLADFADIVRYTAERNPTGAEALRLRIVDSTAELARMPYLGAVYERDRSLRTREIQCGPYRVFYRVLDALAQVQILRVWHGTRTEPRLPPA